MAKFTSGAGFGIASGSVAAVCYSHNRFGPYIRNKTIPVNTNTFLQQAYRQRFGNFSQQWRGLTSSQRAEWITQAPNIVLVDALGNPYSPTGHQYFVSINLNRLNVGGSLASTPPALQTQAVITAFTVTAVGSTGVVTLTFAPAIAAASFYILQATRPMSAGINFVGRSEFKQLSTLGVADTSPAISTTQYAAIFGTLTALDVGKAIFFRMVPQSSNGYRGTPLMYKAIVT